MEIKAELSSPFTENERVDFIIQQNHKNGYIIEKRENGLVALDYTEEEKEQQERERVNNLTCTKRVFALALQDFGITYSQLKNLIAGNENAQLEWDLCVVLHRNNPLLNTMAAELNINSKTLDYIFKRANSEVC